MSRIVSFSILVAILLVIAWLFFRVMADFLLPMFLAVLLVVMFGPVHRWFQARCKGRNHLAAGLTTVTIILIFLVPLLLILLQAASESVDIYRNIRSYDVDLKKLAETASEFGGRIGLQLDTAEIEEKISSNLQEILTPLALGTGQFLLNLSLGLFVMIVSLYYFLADGPEMIRAVMRLSPLDDKYEDQLAGQFADISRTVVIATLLSAFVQGILAGVGFYFAGVGSVFLLMVLTMLLAMVPFIGAAAVWAPVCLWLYFFDGQLLPAVLLAVYGVVIVSMADNVIKPLVLHGRSNLHPLLALLSVLGGVTALGPIGIFVGPMVVVFLQTVLNMLHTELDTL